jgi:hypothetical protein
MGTPNHSSELDVLQARHSKQRPKWTVIMLRMLSVALLLIRPSLQQNATEAVVRVGNVSSSCPAYAITVVQNAFLWPASDWRVIFGGQLRDLRDSGLVHCAAVHIVLSAPHGTVDHNHAKMEGLLSEARILAYSIMPRKVAASRVGAIVTTVHENSFEHPGLHHLWLLAQSLSAEEAAKHVFLYFHTKGMVFHNPPGVRLPEELFMVDRTIRPWRDVVDIFQGNQTVSRIAVWPSHQGYLWQNFFWVRASYVVLLEEPRRTSWRDYFETWVVCTVLPNSTAPEDWPHGAKHPQCQTDCTTCFSLCNYKHSTTYNPHQVAWPCPEPPRGHELPHKNFTVTYQG